MWSLKHQSASAVADRLRTDHPALIRLLRFNGGVKGNYDIFFYHRQSKEMAQVEKKGVIGCNEHVWTLLVEYGSTARVVLFKHI